MSIDVSDLQNWPDAGSIRTAASDLQSACKSFHTDATTLQTTWKRLNGAGTYETPERSHLVSAVDTAVTNAEHVETAGTSIQAALDVFADALGDLEPRRTTLLKEAADFDKLPAPDPKDPVAVHDHQLAGGQVASKITALVNDFNAAVTACSKALDGIDTEGKPDDALLSAGMKYGKGPTMGLVGMAVKTWTQNQRLTYTQRVFKVAGVDFEIPFTKNVTSRTVSGTKFDMTKLKEFQLELAKDPEAFLSKFGEKLRERYLVKPNSAWSDPVKISESTKNWGFSVEEFEQTRKTAPAAARWGGRALGAIGTGLSIWSEEEKAYDKLGSTNPGMSDDERRSQAIETGVVRGGSQALAAGVTTAAICSVVPGVGTVGGFVVGVGVGYAMSLKLPGDDKSIGDHIADKAEDAWNTVKGWFH